MPDAKPSQSERLHNEDLAPAKERTWGTYSLFAMWMSDVHSLGGYTFAAGLFFLGLTTWQVFVALIFGITIVYVLMNLTGMAGQQHGIPYPVVSRLSFGLFGANIPALIRAIVAVIWYGIQTWLASVAVVVLALEVFPGLEPLNESSFLGLSYLGWLAFLLLWAAQLLVLRRGMETVRRFVDFAGPAIYVVMFVMAAWILIEAGGEFSLNLSSRELSFGETLLQFFTAAALVVAYFSTLLLNFSDFARFAPSRRTVIWGNFWGLPVNFALFSAVIVIVTGGSIAVYGEAVTDPVELVSRIPSTFALILGAITFAIATVGINIVANFVSPAYDFANVAPKYINFRRGGLITAVLAVSVLPWYIYRNPVAINYFLGGLGSLLGPLFGVIIADYFLVKKQRVVVEDLYKWGEESRYWYQGGINRKALWAFIPAAAISVIIALIPTFGTLSPFSWFIGAGLAASLYWILMTRGGSQSAPQRAQADEQQD